MEKKNFLDHVNEKKEEVEVLESFKGESFEVVRRSFKWPLILVLCIMFGLLSLYLMSNKKAVVADLTNLTVEEGHFWATQSDLNMSVMEVYSDLEVGRIQSQDVAPGTKLAPESIIKVTVSKGQDPYGLVTLPSFDQSWTQSAIVTWLDQNGIENYTFVEEVSMVEEGYLVRYKLLGVEPEGFNRSSEIEFVISQISDTSSVEVPDFINMTLTDVDKWATGEGVSYDYSYESNNLYDEDRIFFQSMTPEDNMSREEVLTLKVSLGTGFEAVEMENLMNQSLSQGESWLKNHRIPYKVEYRYSDLYGDKIIMDQSVYEGSIPDGTVILTVSMGEGMVMPDFSTLNVSEAERLIDQYDNIELVEVYDTRPEGQWILQTVAPGQVTGVDDSVAVWYSLGQNLAMEDFRGENLLSLEDWIFEQNQAGAQLTYKVTKVVSDNYENGLIVRQDSINKKIPLDTEILVEVSVGLTIPDFKTLSKSEAERFAENSHLDLDIVERYDEKETFGNFIYQTVPWGQLGETNEYVEVAYSLGNALIVPNYLDQPISSLESWVIEQNQMGAQLTLNIHERFDNEIGYGNIISQSAFSRYVPVGTSLEVLVSRGEAYTVPDFTHYLETSIESICSANDVSVVFKKVTSDLAPGKVVSQSPAPGTEMSKDEFIIIEISE